MKKARISLRGSFIRLPIAALTLALLLLSSVSPVFASGEARNGHQFVQVGPKQHYLAIGESLAFGLQPDGDFTHGYADLFAQHLSTKGVTDYANMGCPGESSTTFVSGGCPFPTLRKFPYEGAQFDAALNYIHQNAGQVSPVTLTLGSNELLPLFNQTTCETNDAAFDSTLATLDTNLRQVILPALKQALTVNGEITGDIMVLDYYNPFQNICPNTIPFVETLNAHIAQDVKGFATFIDIYQLFGGSQEPNPLTCTLTWMCSTTTPDFHPTDEGYAVIESALETGKYA